MTTVLDPAAVADATDALGVGAGEAPPGTYTLVFTVDAETRLSVGALGTVTFPAGAYAYTGSAFGSNGLGRVARHCRVARGDHDVRHWHVDYFGGHDATTLAAIYAAPRRDVECAVAAALDPETGPASGFGASDCDCAAHLAHRADKGTLRSAVRDSYEGKELGEDPSNRASPGRPTRPSAGKSEAPRRTNIVCSSTYTHPSVPHSRSGTRI